MGSLPTMTKQFRFGFVLNDSFDVWGLMVMKTSEIRLACLLGYSICDLHYENMVSEYFMIATLWDFQIAILGYFKKSP